MHLNTSNSMKIENSLKASWYSKHRTSQAVDKIDRETKDQIFLVTNKLEFY